MGLIRASHSGGFHDSSATLPRASLSFSFAVCGVVLHSDARQRRVATFRLRRQTGSPKSCIAHGQKLYNSLCSLSVSLTLYHSVAHRLLSANGSFMGQQTVQEKLHTACGHGTHSQSTRAHSVCALALAAACCLTSACSLTFSLAHMAVARLRPVTMPSAAPRSMIILVGLNCVEMPYSEAA